MQKITTGKFHNVTMAYLCFALALACSVNDTHAQELVLEIEVDPDLRTIQIDGTSQDISLVAQSAQQDLMFEWTLQGPGELLGDIGSPGIFYVPPAKIDAGTTRQATVVLTVHDARGNRANKKIVFTLLTASTLLPQIHSFALQELDGSPVRQNPQKRYLLKPGARMQIVSRYSSEAAWTLRYQSIRGDVDRNAVYTAPDRNGVRDMISINVSNGEEEYTLAFPILKVQTSSD